MNYIELIKRFWTSHYEHSFSTTEIALYFHLLEVFNLCQWKNQIKRNNHKIQADLGISYNTLKNARNRLQQANLIYFKSKNGNANVNYSLSKFDEVTSEVGIKVTDEVTSEVGTSKDKLNQTKHKEKSKKEIEEAFEKFRKEYPGTKRGFETEYHNFTKKHSDYQTSVFLLLPALQKLKAWRAKKSQLNQFIPEYANLQTWINQRRWENELEPIQEGEDNEQSKPTAINLHPSLLN